MQGLGVVRSGENKGSFWGTAKRQWPGGGGPARTRTNLRSIREGRGYLKGGVKNTTVELLERWQVEQQKGKRGGVNKGGNVDAKRKKESYELTETSERRG